MNVIRSVFTGSRLNEIDTRMGKSETMFGKINLYTKYSQKPCSPICISKPTASMLQRFGEKRRAFCVRDLSSSGWLADPPAGLALLSCSSWFTRVSMCQSLRGPGLVNLVCSGYEPRHQRSAGDSVLPKGPCFMPLTNQMWERIAYLFVSVFLSDSCSYKALGAAINFEQSKCFLLVSCENYGNLLMSFLYLHFSKAGAAEIYSQKPAGCGCFKSYQLYAGRSLCKWQTGVDFTKEKATFHFPCSL